MNTNNTNHTIPRFSYLLLLILTAACLIFPYLTGAAHAGTVSLPQTGQTTTYATGDDGALQVGVAWPNPRFTDNRDQTMTDNLTGLVWTKDAGTPTVGNCVGGSMDWQAALDYVACLNAANYLGQSDWRLPNINELESVVNAGQTNPATWLNAQGFINAQSEDPSILWQSFKYGYWSSTTYTSDTSNAWVIFMNNGSLYAFDKSSNAYVWVLRTGQSGAFGNSAIWSTGQTLTYGAGDDGTLSKGVTWPVPRFTDNGNGTVTDGLTGLVWTNDAGTPTVETCTGGYMSWQEALNYVKCLNAANYLGYSDWRLPNRKELFSLVDHGKYNPALASNHPFASVLSKNYYWLSTTCAYNTSGAWYFGVYDGYLDVGGKSYYVYVWPVRSGQVGNSANMTISISGTGGGTVTVSPGTITWNGNMGTAGYAPDTTVTLTAQPDMTSILGEWSGCDTVSSNQCTVKMTGNKSVTVTFNTINGYLLTVTKTGFGDGTIATSEGSLTWSSNVGSAMYKSATRVVITANPDKGSKFAGWTGCNLPLCIVEMTAKKNVTAKFNKCSTARKDFDGDGKSDILWQDVNSGAVAIWQMNGTTKKSNDLAVSSVPNNWQIRAAEDFNADGKGDILWQNTDTGDMYVWLMDASTIQEKGLVGNVPSNWQIKATGDFSNDCSSDILWQDSVTGDVDIWLMDGTKIMDQAIVQKGMPGQWQFAGLGDLNGDGNADIVWQDTTNGDIYGWLMDGIDIAQKGFIARGITFDWQIKAVADYNDDGKDDIYLKNADPNKDVIFLMNGLKPTPKIVTHKSNGSQSGHMTGRASGADTWDMKTTGDYNGDGMNDMVWQDGSTGDVYMWTNDGTTGSGYTGGYVDYGVPADWSIY
ncbi:secreted protein containing DUF1566 [Candidatus Magnetobacterium bavaricum]|uniref:Secreted protein containing DUF1566 n=1 Tax=Candidatus Magnetobacterium bavaricum TaxID=29290 RepID=A0A0F3GWF9_9BACT|nr:secreted protein containing DUF1566 [Candidatus Magnetobacterium bavaricum]